LLIPNVITWTPASVSGKAVLSVRLSTDTVLTQQRRGRSGAGLCTEAVTELIIECQSP
jgi:hypothetical protein